MIDARFVPVDRWPIKATSYRKRSPFRAKYEKRNKKNPGPLYEIKGHAWSALALATAFAERSEAQHA